MRDFKIGDEVLLKIPVELNITYKVVQISCREILIEPLNNSVCNRLVTRGEITLSKKQLREERLKEIGIC
jgi:hypothetical protein